MFQKFNYKGGRTFVVGDIHGEFELLENKLDLKGFDRFNDNLFSVGDLVDRGPQSHKARNYLNAKWFHAVRGNHEQMCIDAGGTFWHVQNGGAWWNELDEKEQARTIAAFKALPLILQFETPTERQIGVVHAGFWAVREGWKDLENVARLSAGMHDNPLLWDREQIRATKWAPDKSFTVEGIDEIFCGHTPVKEPIHKGNIRWIDTGAFATGKLTVLEVE